MQSDPAAIAYFRAAPAPPHRLEWLDEEGRQIRDEHGDVNIRGALVGSAAPDGAVEIRLHKRGERGLIHIRLDVDAIPETFPELIDAKAPGDLL